MKQFHRLAAMALSISSLSAQTNVTILSEDFETGGGNLTNGNNGLDLTVVANPLPGGTGMVGQGDSAEVGTQWGALLANPNIIELPAAVEPGTSTFAISMMVYIPTGTTFTADDRMGVIVRWNSLQTSAASNYQRIDTFTPDTWQEISLTGTIPALDGNGNTVTQAYPIISFNDVNDDALAGVSAYVDDYKFEVSVSEDDPNFPLGTDLGYGDIDQNGGPHTKKLVLTNSGASQTLTITAAALSGTNADLFTLSTLALPLDILPGASETLEVTLDPGAELGPLTARLEFTSNDPTTPTISTFLSANSIEPFQGLELIVNGDFETGNAEGWREDNRFIYSEDVSRSGSGSGIYTMLAGQQWGEARQSAVAPSSDSAEQGTFDITPEMIGKNYFYSGWYYRPSTGGPADDDDVRLIIRWNGKNGFTNHTDGAKLVGSLPTDTWVRSTLSNVIPSVDLDGLPVTHATFLWSFQDVGANSMGTEIMYIDDMSLKVDVPIIEPVVDLIITNLSVDKTTNNVSFNYSASIGAEYAIDRSTQMLPSGQPGGWVEIDDPTADEALETFTDPGAAATSPLYFYRVRLIE
jgi:hypothetical protein